MCVSLQRVAACCSVLQCVTAGHRGLYQSVIAQCCNVLQSVAECFDVLRCVAAGKHRNVSDVPEYECIVLCLSVLQRVEACCIMLQCVAARNQKKNRVVAVRRNLLQKMTVCFTTLQCVATHCNTVNMGGSHS